MAVVVARMVASLEAETSQFHGRMTAAEQQLAKWSNATVTGRRATILLNNGLQQLAFQAASIPGPIGKAGAAIGSLAVGGGPIMLLVAALGLLALAWKQMDAAAQLAADNAVAAANRLQRNIERAAGGATTALFERRIAEARAELAVLRASPLGAQQFREIHGPEGVTTLPVGSPAADRAAEIAKREEVILRLTAGLAAVEDRLRLSPEEAARRASLARIVPEVADIVSPEALFARDQARMRGQLSIDIARDDAARTHIRQRGQAPTTPGGFQMTPEFAVMSAMALVQGAQSGSVGGFLGAAAGPVAMINPLAGAITAGLGGIFGMFDNNEDRRHRELIDKIEKMGQEVGLDRVTIVFTGPDGHQIRKSLAELEEGDAVERVPGPVGATG